MTQATVLIVDDEKNIRRALRMILESEGLLVLEAASAEEALRAIEHEECDAVIMDIRLGGMSGVDALAKIRSEPATQKLPVIVISGHASVAEAVLAVQAGATDFFEKPLDRERIVVSVRNALHTFRLERTLAALQQDTRSRYEMIGQSRIMQQLYSELEKVAPTKGRVLITGESGTGKELIARAIHLLSPRKEAPFVKVNCAAIPGELIESELFGYERGAFTGAGARKKGLFELANHGTLFLDEIGDMSAGAQAKVLRALQSGEITRVGSEATITVDVRVIAATNRDLEAAVHAGQFREDLFFRLNVVPIRSPALRERREDVPMLARSFLEEFCRENGMREKPIDDDVLLSLSRREWPGNVRELRNVVERMAILSGDEIRMEDVPQDAGHRETMPPPPDLSDSTLAPDSPPLPLGARLSLREHKDQAEKSYILQTLGACHWNISKTAAVLGVERTNLHKKMRSFGIKRGEEEEESEPG